MRIFLTVITLTGILSAAFAANGPYYIGASQINVEGGYSSERLNFGIGIRALNYELNRPSHFISSGNLELTAYYLQKRIGVAKVQFGNCYQGSFVYQGNGIGLNLGSSIGIIKVGVETAIGNSFGAYWDCVPVSLTNFNLSKPDNQDNNRVDFGILEQKIGIRIFL